MIINTYLIILFTAFSGLSTELAGQCEVDTSFKDVYTFLSANKKNHIEIQITHVNLSHQSGSHFYTSWGRAIQSEIDELCKLNFNLSMKYSDRNFFKGHEDRVSYSIDLKNNTLTSVYNEWDNAVVNYDNLIREKNLIYCLTATGMTILNLKFIEGNNATR